MVITTNARPIKKCLICNGEWDIYKTETDIGITCPGWTHWVVAGP